MDTHKTQGTDERIFFCGNLERFRVQEHHRREAEEGKHSLPSGTECSVASAFELQMLLALFWWLQDSRAFLLWRWRWHTVRVAAPWPLGCLEITKASAADSPRKEETEEEENDCC